MSFLLQGSASEADNNTKFLAMVRMIAPLIAIWGMSLETYHAIISGQFDLQSFFQAAAYLFGALFFILGGNQLTDFLKGRNTVAAQKTAAGVPPNAP